MLDVAPHASPTPSTENTFITGDLCDDSAAQQAVIDNGRTITERISEDSSIGNFPVTEGPAKDTKDGYTDVYSEHNLSMSCGSTIREHEACSSVQDRPGSNSRHSSALGADAEELKKPEYLLLISEPESESTLLTPTTGTTNAQLALSGTTAQSKPTKSDSELQHFSPLPDGSRLCQAPPRPTLRYRDSLQLAATRARTQTQTAPASAAQVPSQVTVDTKVTEVAAVMLAFASDRSKSTCDSSVLSTLSTTVTSSALATAE